MTKVLCLRPVAGNSRELRLFLPRVIEIYGSESSGKTTVALHVLAEVQKVGEIVAFVDAEHALDAGCMQFVGVSSK